MKYSDFVLPRRKVITIRYRDKYVDLVSDTDHCGTMTQSTDGERIEFDFSECRVIGVRDIPVQNEYEKATLEQEPVLYLRSGQDEPVNEGEVL